MHKTIHRARTTTTLAALLALVSTGCADESSESENPLYVNTASGPIEGVSEGATRTFLGIPYARPPVDELRFAPPQAVEPWKERLMVGQFGPSCPQERGGLGPTGLQDEDCLTLNIYTPEEASDVSRPVMVFIHGGGFVAGGSASYSGAQLSESQDVVVVTLNYRLGALGFNALPALEEVLGIPPGNMGLRDQRLALEWVRENIEVFGGDKDNVTLFGESAGAMSTCFQMFIEGSEQFSHRFVMESGVCLDENTEALVGKGLVEVSEEMAVELCPDEDDVVACLRGLSVTELVDYRSDASIFGAGWAPHIDGPGGLFSQPISTLLSNGEYNKGAVLLGTNRNEWGLFTLPGLGDEPPQDAASFEALIDERFGSVAPLVKDFYIPAADGEVPQAYVDMMTDFAFRCPSRQLARGLSANNPDAFLYSFEVAPALHAQELDYVFGSKTIGILLGAPVSDALARDVQEYWANFARTGNPNGGMLTNWPAYQTASDQHLAIAMPTRSDSALRTDACDLLTAGP